MIFANTVITGGGGFIGRAILAQRYVHNRWPGAVMCALGRDPMKLQKVRERFGAPTIIGDVMDTEGLATAFAGRSCVIHAAAMKHIPQGEEQPTECFDINTLGSLNVIRAAVQQQVPHLVLISTDKAAEPVNAYGASKFMMERIAQEMSWRQNRTSIHMVRYGNVVGSTGSVIPLFQKQADAGEKLTITDPAMTRFWLSPSMAIEAIEQALVRPTGTIFVPRLHAMTMRELATMFEPDPERHSIIGVRPGEKLHECLLSELEGYRSLRADGHFIIHPTGSFASNKTVGPFTSDMAETMTSQQMAAWIEEGAGA